MTLLAAILDFFPEFIKMTKCDTKLDLKLTKMDRMVKKKLNLYDKPLQLDNSYRYFVCHCLPLIRGRQNYTD